MLSEEYVKDKPLRAHFFCDKHGIIGKSHFVMDHSEAEWMQVELHTIEFHNGDKDTWVVSNWKE